MGPSAVNPASPCIFTRGIDRLELPVRHGEGKFYAPMRMSWSAWWPPTRWCCAMPCRTARPARGLFPDNPNGSLDDIAGICDPTGRIFGLMPHPEAYNHWTNHPDWTRRKHMRRLNPGSAPPGVPGTRIFENAVDFLKAA